MKRNRRGRQNPDEDLRGLLRTALEGDPDAQARLERAVARGGIAVAQALGPVADDVYVHDPAGGDAASRWVVVAIRRGLAEHLGFFGYLWYRSMHHWEHEHGRWGLGPDSRGLGPASRRPRQNPDEERRSTGRGVDMGDPESIEQGFYGAVRAGDEQRALRLMDAMSDLITYWTLNWPPLISERDAQAMGEEAFATWRAQNDAAIDLAVGREQDATARWHRMADHFWRHRNPGPGHTHPILPRPLPRKRLEAELRHLHKKAGLGPAKIRWPVTLTLEHLGQPRRYAQVTPRDMPVVYELAEQTRWLPGRYRKGLFAHEVGHVLSPDTGEPGADEAALRHLGIAIDYDPQWPARVGGSGGRGLEVAINPGDERFRILRRQGDEGDPMAAFRAAADAERRDGRAAELAAFALRCNEDGLEVFYRAIANLLGSPGNLLGGPAPGNALAYWFWIDERQSERPDRWGRTGLVSVRDRPYALLPRQATPFGFTVFEVPRTSLPEREAGGFEVVSLEVARRFVTLYAGGWRPPRRNPAANEDLLGQVFDVLKDRNDASAWQRLLVTARRRGFAVRGMTYGGVVLYVFGLTDDPGGNVAELGKIFVIVGEGLRHDGWRAPIAAEKIAGLELVPTYSQQNPGDEDRRRRERRGGGVVDQVRVLADRVRRGEVNARHLEALACLGDDVARAVTPCPPFGPGDEWAWIEEDRIERDGPVFAVIAGMSMIETLDPLIASLPSSYPNASTPRSVYLSILMGARAWLANDTGRRGSTMRHPTARGGYVDAVSGRFVSDVDACFWPGALRQLHEGFVASRGLRDPQWAVYAEEAILELMNLVTAADMALPSWGRAGTLPTIVGAGYNTHDYRAFPFFLWGVRRDVGNARGLAGGSHHDSAALNLAIRNSLSPWVYAGSPDLVPRRMLPGADVRRNPDEDLRELTRGVMAELDNLGLWQRLLREAQRRGLVVLAYKDPLHSFSAVERAYYAMHDSGMVVLDGSDGYHRYSYAARYTNDVDLVPLESRVGLHACDRCGEWNAQPDEVMCPKCRKAFRDYRRPRNNPRKRKRARRR